MLPYLVALGVLLHVLFWGAGLAAAIMPRPWARFWPILAAPCGLALQSLVVWLGAHAGWRGTDAYAWPAEAIPLALLLIGLRRRPGFGRGEVFRLGAIGLVMAGCLALWVTPLARAAGGLTTASLGNCDAADYAAGARVLKEFARGDRTGFLGLTEVVRVMSVDNFFDFWLKLNHFTPSALIALNGTILHCAPYELTGLATAAFFVSSLPVIFWIARALLRYRPWPSVALAALAGISPIMGYAVVQVAIGQLLALPAVALIAWAGVRLWRGPATFQAGARFSGVLLVAYGLVLGSYNFIVVVCAVPALAFAGAQALAGRQWRRFGLWLLAMLAPLAVAGFVFWERVTGLVERFRLFRAYDFGWSIPGLAPDGWLGIVGGTSLEPIPGPSHWALAAAVLFAWGAAIWRGGRARDARAGLALALTLPILLGYYYLLWRGARLGTHASYDAYKLFAVFYGLLLPGLFYWLTLARPRSIRLRWAVGLLAAAVVAGNIRAARLFVRADSSPPLIVDRELVDLQRVETMIGVDSLNLEIPDMWSRLWANAFLLRKAQYFPTHTYEGRRNTPLRGQWDLNGGGVGVVLPDAASQRLDAQYSLAQVSSPYFLRAALGAGWYETERLPRTSVRWRWSGPGSVLRLENPQDHPLRAVLNFDARARVAGRIVVRQSGRALASGAIGPDRAVLRLPPIEIAPGAQDLEIGTDPPAAAVPGDSRRLGLCLYGLEVEVLKQP